MPRYHFNISDGHVIAKDRTGTDHENDVMAHAEAIKGARFLMAESDGLGLCRRHWQMVITDGRGEPLLIVPFDDALKPDRLTDDDIGSLLSREPS